MVRVGDVEDRLPLAHGRPFLDLVLDRSPAIRLLRVDHDPVARRVDRAVRDRRFELLEPVFLDLERRFLGELIGADGFDLGLKRLEDLRRRELFEPLGHPLGLIQGDFGLLKRRAVGLELRGGAEALLHRRQRPDVVLVGPLVLDAAGGDILANQLLVLGIDTVAILAEGDLVDLQVGTGLFDPGFGLDVTDALGLQFIAEGGGIEFANHVPLLDAGSFGKDGDDPGRAGLLLRQVAAAAATAAAPTPAATTTTTAATATASPLVEDDGCGLLRGWRLGAEGHVRSDRVAEAADARLLDAGGRGPLLTRSRARLRSADRPDQGFDLAPGGRVVRAFQRAVLDNDQFNVSFVHGQGRQRDGSVHARPGRPDLRSHGQQTERRGENDRQKEPTPPGAEWRLGDDERGGGIEIQRHRETPSRREPERKTA